ncbi:GNAT family N-acetyltransferase [Actinospica sp. MGRD01-02]|uniref:GNAT family N-acetyltransferase n=1 Tax=Actinospica acidithermotolerans TaxID=2828514 RepID=A0A941E4Z4_9ACTN|nr:GNAT family protein [Actinospica acidithermotolerans]MBR7826385.1 GNAT family N-acetyltransferase [Actinospica acidithermotolerans]
MTTEARRAAGPRSFANVTLRTERLLLRPWAEADIDAITAACQDPEIQRYVPIPAPYSRTDAEVFVREVLPAGRAAGTDVVFGVFDADTALPVASVGLHRIKHLDAPCGGTAEIGYWATPAARGLGYTTEAVREVCRWAFADLALARVEWLALAGNEGSWRVVEKLGFTREGTLRFYTIQRGARHDMWIASLLRSEAKLG